MSSLSEQLVLMKQNLADVEDHLNKLQSGRKASSAKARASLMKLKKDSHQLRGDIIKYTKELPVKSRNKKEEQVNILDAKLSQAEEVVDEPVEEVQSSEEENKASTKKATKKRVVKKKV